MSVLDDLDAVSQLIIDCSQFVGLGTTPIVLQEDCLKRIMHAADYEFGLAIDTIIAAVGIALFAGSQQLAVAHFAEFFRIKSGCLDVHNPFVALEYLRLDVRKLAWDGENNE